MEPTTLIAPPSPLGLPAPYWLLATLKVVGFILHACIMNLWYAGIPLALALRWAGTAPGATLSGRLMKAMPILVALGINFGIVPLLFVQVAWYQVFYPATILMAWPWLGVIPLLTLAYYGVYAYATGLRTGHPARWQVAAGWMAAAFFLVIGFLFVNAFSLMARMEAWPDLWTRTSVAGAPLGIGLNLGDPTLLPRWLMFLALAFTTTAVYVLVDSAWFARGEDEGYRRWAAGFAWKLHTAGLVGFALLGSWYVFGTWSDDLRTAMGSGQGLTLSVLAAVSPGLPWLLLAAAWRQGPTRPLALAAGLAQGAVLAANALARQAVQNQEIGRYLDVAAGRVDTQWSPLVVFLVLLVAGVAAVAWLVARAVAESREALPVAAGPPGGASRQR